MSPREGDQQEPPKPFLRAVLSGGRFASHSIPVETLQEFAAYEALVLSVAKELVKAERGKRRVPKGFEQSFGLELSAIAAGSVIASLKRKSDGFLPAIGDGHFEEARDLVADAIAAVAAEASLPQRFPADALPFFQPFGKHLRDDEFIDLRTPGGDRPALYSVAVRRKILDLSPDSSYSDECRLSGTVPSIDQDKHQLVIHLDPDGRTLLTEYLPSLTESILATLKGYEASQRILIEAACELDYHDSVRKIHLVRTAESVDAATSQEVQRLQDRIDTFSELEPGWYAGEGTAPISHTRNLARKVATELILFFGLAPPAVYPSQDGTIRLEWNEGQWDISAQVYSASLDLHALNKSTAEVRESRIMVSPQMTETVAAFIEPLIEDAH